MSKPIYWAIGAGVALAIIWMVIGGKESLPDPAPVANAAAHAETLAAKPETAAPDKPVNTASAIPAALANDALPIDVTTGFELLNTKASSLKDTDPTKALLLRHEELQSQPRDTDWSEQMETTLRQGFQDSLMATGVGSHRVELPVVECRVTGCEIQAIAFREDIRNQGANVQLIVAKLLTGPLGSELDNPHGRMSGLPDGRVSYIILLDRRVR